MCSETGEAVGTIWEHAQLKFQKFLKIRIPLLGEAEQGQVEKSLKFEEVVERAVRLRLRAEQNQVDNSSTNRSGFNLLHCYIAYNKVTPEPYITTFCTLFDRK